MGYVNCKDIVSKTGNIFHEGTNDCIINIGEELKIRIWSIGDVYYIGNPVIVEKDINHQGQLIQMQ